MTTRIEPSSGNVFADLGLPDAEALLVKSELTMRISDIIKNKGWSRTQAAARLGIDAPKVSKLRRGSALKEFSYERLMHFLNLLGQDVQVVMKPRRRGVGRTRVVRAA